VRCDVLQPCRYGIGIGDLVNDKRKIVRSTAHTKQALEGSYSINHWFIPEPTANGQL
jgi:hypothetical protein